jgi:hypothetical protein
LIGEPSATAPGADEMKRTRDLHSHDQDIDEKLKLIKSLRDKLYVLIKNLPESVWSNSDGVITMDTWLNTFEQHIPERIEQMQANFDDWMRRRERVKNQKLLSLCMIYGLHPVKLPVFA